MSVFAFIFARGGSKGLPRKNLLPLGGIPLLAHSILTARKVATIDAIFVSTEDPEIAEVASTYGASIIHRPRDLASDTSPEWLSWRHAVEVLRADGKQCSTFVSLPPTSPLRSVQDVEKAINLLDDETDIVITVTPASRSPYFNMVSRKSDGSSDIFLPDKQITRRQDAGEVYDMTTVAYVTRPSFITDKSRIFEGKVKSLVIPKERAVDIDDYMDFMFAQTIMNTRL